MKKLAVLLAVVSIAALAAPALSATNPFMDVPMNHWAYDAIGQLAAHGILSGYPDGLYKGQQQTTRYEMASALARSLAVVDMTKASKQDVEMLKRLVVEFKDELEALGVKVAELDERVAVFEDRLGGWKISGVLALDVTYRKENKPTNGDPSGESDTTIDYDDAKINFERFWGEDDEYYFRLRFNNDRTIANGLNTTADRFFVEMPFFFDSRLTVGRFNWALEGDYRIKSNIGRYETGGWDGAQLMTDWTWNGFGVTKNFGLGTARLAVAHPNNVLSHKYPNANATAANRRDWDEDNDANFKNWSDWMILLSGKFQFTEQFGLDLGGNVFVGDNAEEKSGNNAYVANDTAFDKMWTIWAGLRFNFNDNIGFKGVFYHQKMDMDKVNANVNAWEDLGYGLVDRNGKVVDDANHWAVIFDIKQEALKYTSLWLEYGQFDQGFMNRNDNGIFLSPSIDWKQAQLDVKYWRVAAGQEWNDKWSTHLFYYGYKVENGLGNDDWKPAEMGLGVQYKLNDYTTMGLNYMHVKDATMARDSDDDDVIRMRTTIDF